MMNKKDLVWNEVLRRWEIKSSTQTVEPPAEIVNVCGGKDHEAFTVRTAPDTVCCLRCNLVGYHRTNYPEQWPVLKGKKAKKHPLLAEAEQPRDDDPVLRWFDYPNEEEGGR